MSPTRAAIGIIGGSGLYEMDGISNLESVEIDTPFGHPSDAIALGSLDGVPVAFLPRHGRGHRINPTNIPFRANVYALKTLGVRRIISVSAVGSLQEEFAPLDLVVPRPTYRPYQAAGLYVLRRRHHCPRSAGRPLLCSRFLHRSRASSRTGHSRPPFRHSRRHRRPRLLHTRRELHVPLLGGPTLSA